MKVTLTKEKVYKIKVWLDKHKSEVFYYKENQADIGIQAEACGIYFGGYKVLEKLNILKQIENEEFGEFTVDEEGYKYIISKLRKQKIKVFLDSLSDGMTEVLQILEIN